MNCFDVYFLLDFFFFTRNILQRRHSLLPEADNEMLERFPVESYLLFFKSLLKLLLVRFSASIAYMSHLLCKMKL